MLNVPENIRAAVRNNGGGHANHTLFWTVMSPQGGGRPVQALHRAPELTARGCEHHHVVDEAHVEQPELLHRRIERAEAQRAVAGVSAIRSGPRASEL